MFQLSKSPPLKKGDLGGFGTLGKSPKEYVRQVLSPPPSPPAAGDGPSAETVATAIFTETALSYESNDLFDQEFSGARVTWTGELKSIRAYQYDADFGDEPGVKAVVTIASVQHDLYGNTSIDAVVALPPGSDRGRARHDTVTISGILTKVDPLMRNIFVEDATLA